MRRYDKLQNKQQQRTGEKKKNEINIFFNEFHKKNEIFYIYRCRKKYIKLIFYKWLTDFYFDSIKGLC